MIGVNLGKYFNQKDVKYPSRVFSDSGAGAHSNEFV